MVIVLSIILYFLVVFISYYFLVKRHILKYNNSNTELYQFVCLLWPLSILVYICVCPFLLMDRIDKYILKIKGEH